MRSIPYHILAFLFLLTTFRAIKVHQVRSSGTFPNHFTPLSNKVGVQTHFRRDLLNHGTIAMSATKSRNNGGNQLERKKLC